MIVSAPKLPLTEVIAVFAATRVIVLARVPPVALNPLRSIVFKSAAAVSGVTVIVLAPAPRSP
ncbi:hypothetical protein CFF27374_02410 [Campylobacter fetus subsp. fetus]|nr:hypothetical protein CFF27374_02410 [Campylobacter fetus subsp. fetus]